MEEPSFHKQIKELAPIWNIVVYVLLQPYYWFYITIKRTGLDTMEQNGERFFYLPDVSWNHTCHGFIKQIQIWKREVYRRKNGNKATIFWIWYIFSIISYVF